MLVQLMNIILTGMCSSADTVVPVGRLQVNSIENLIRITTASVVLETDKDPELLMDILQPSADDGSFPTFVTNIYPYYIFITINPPLCFCFN